MSNNQLEERCTSLKLFYQHFDLCQYNALNIIAGQMHRTVKNFRKTKGVWNHDS